jgi:hypothetical protein
MTVKHAMGLVKEVEEVKVRGHFAGRRWQAQALFATQDAAMNSRFSYQYKSILQSNVMNRYLKNGMA